MAVRLRSRRVGAPGGRQMFSWGWSKPLRIFATGPMCSDADVQFFVELSFFHVDCLDEEVHQGKDVAAEKHKVIAARLYLCNMQHWTEGIPDTIFIPPLPQNEHTP